MSGQPKVEILANGQPRPYADRVYHARVTFDDADDADEATIRKRLAELYIGFTEFTYPPKGREATAEDFFRTRLDWLRNTKPGVWEFHTTSAFTD